MDNAAKSYLFQKFQKPETKYRGTPFWSWNAEMDQEEVREQIREFHAQGVGGFFIHSRDGLETPYMGEKWFQCVEAAVDEAKKLGMYAWLYDEDRWPSGNAGGQVSAGGDEYRLKGLTLQVCEECEDSVWTEENLVAVFEACVKEDAIYSLKRLQTPLKAEKVTAAVDAESADAPADSRKVMLIFRLAVSGKSEWFNNETPPDNLNPETIKRYLLLTHEKYFERFGGEFGKTIPGIFTDEPSLADSHSAFGADRSWIPWTNGFAEFFHEKKGYDPIDLIPYVYFDGAYSNKIRHDYWHVIAIRYSENYSGGISKWCREHNLAMTGHFLQEDKLGLSTRVSGAVMPLYEYEDIPGIDILQDKTDEFMTVKQCVSVAHQMGRKNVITETYAVTGWDFTFEGQRHIGDWQYALGVNKRCQHLALYSLTGGRKRDCPPGFGYNTPWWCKNHVVEDYFARLSAVLEEGEPNQKFLMLHPASTAWSMMGTSPYGNPIRRNERDLPKVNEYGWKYNALIENLCGQHLDPDLGDEILLAKYGSVENGVLKMGKMQYSVVVIPQIRTMLTSTFELLEKFVSQGGRLIVMSPCADMLDGEESPLPGKLFTTDKCILAADEKDLLKELEVAGIRTISIQNAEGREEQKCIALQKMLDAGELIFVVNYNMEEGCKVHISIPQRGTVEEWDALSGKRKSITSFGEGQQTTFPAKLEPGESRLFFVDYTGETEEKGNGQMPEKTETIRTVYFFPEESPITLTDSNILTLDCCRYCLKDTWSETMQVWEAQEQIRHSLGMRSIAALGTEQRYRWIDKPHPADGEKIALEFSFENADDRLEYAELVLEHPEKFEIFCNGETVEAKYKGYLYDRGLLRIPLPKLKMGENRLLLQCHYLNSMELENCYLAGSFGVDESRKIVPVPRKLFVGSWTKQGLYHYAGSVKYHYDFEWNSGMKINPDSRIYLELTDFNATCVTAKLGEHSYEIPWTSAGKVDITDVLSEGKNHLELEVYSSLRNMFGPFHLVGGKPAVTNDAVFRTFGKEFTPEYKVEAYGIMKAPKLIEKF